MTSAPLTDLDQADRLRLLVEAVTDYALYLLDADGNIATWNPGAQRFKGYEAEEIIGQHFSRFYTEEDRATGLPQRALAIAAAEGRFEAEGWRLRKDGSRFWAHVVMDPVMGGDGVPIGYAKITRDVSRKREVDQALRESEQRFRLLVQGVRDYAIYMLDPGGRVTNWNTGAEAIKGYSAEEIVGRHFSVFYTPEDREAGAPAKSLETALREGRFEGEAQRLRKNGERFWANVVVEPILDDAGELLGYAKITRDITEKRQAEAELRKSREALLQAQKMEAIGRLTGGVAHDFNNLLTVIRASADFLRRPGLAEEKRQRYIEAIAETAERATTLTQQLLAFARRQPLQPEAFEVGQRLQALQQLIATTVGSAVVVQIEANAPGLVVRADPSQFDAAILNMVINARDAMPAGGAITLRAEAVDGVPPVRGHAAAQGDFVAIGISDTGTGIPPETLGQIFEPFFTTKPVNQGTGLGLSQVYGFAKQSGGEVDVKSEVGAGATFTLYLQRSRAAVADTQVRSAGPVDLPPGRILLVEDNTSVGQFATHLLQEIGQAVTWVGDAQAAMAQLEASNGAFDAVFSDVVMPGMNGIELGRQIRKRWTDLHVVLTSGYSHVLAEEGSHGFAVLKKPYSLEGLASALRRTG